MRFVSCTETYTSTAHINEDASTQLKLESSEENLHGHVTLIGDFVHPSDGIL